ncbi:UDP-N-acetylmuramate dehydrogenase [Leuconostoc citreum]|jgi:UDP-N-acetylmuramate dehydrogenase|uniref:UDP-N-acetylenolpyruvoylglucosamine reductase n=1 Tax=Leuconostoc citreum TaxID=33964 RepID=A0A5A5U009_LEUCI|nr:UDP-N-acetylmuramate dehydrogenase [Leuconostoc citreum]MBU7450630.1 UDP-N-acetylmuramate dehydrogenase [Leuconostoc citreum]MCP1276629.1 UDP-N-acetylmuramate dehydrogenase [Leuconostoc citreum]MCS8583757.1 UDP-N-acetylmuramate dehydrogenase [Leuconostoc citreum]MCS8587082.1 UDP-N-acetylmuramate dehydrogenase [Leuconostoc citreum]MCS8595141.1 UDP-N-acetylmuramate dehydrogenase [Leuconostoc citreum]
MILNNMTILENQPLAPFAHTQVGGVVDYLAIPKTLTELKEVLDWAKKAQHQVYIFGRLSNLVVRNGGLRGVVILLHELHTIQVTDDTITAEAGADLILVAEVAMEHGLTGLEWGAGIPGSVGGAVFMNAGAYGGQADMVVSSATAIMPNGTIQTFLAEALDFGYRQSIFQENQGIIISATFCLTSDDQRAIKERMDDNNYRRADKQPLNYPSNGSVFKRPEGYFAGKLIMDSGLQGQRVGGVEVSKKHAGFMVNVAQGTGNDYEDLIHFVQDTVQEKYGVMLETEVRIMGER